MVDCGKFVAVIVASEFAEPFDIADAVAIVVAAKKPIGAVVVAAAEVGVVGAVVAVLCDGYG